RPPRPALHPPALDGLQAPVPRALMRLYARLGRREAALRQYHLCADALKRELSTQPEAETTQLCQEILHARPVRSDKVPVPANTIAPIVVADHPPAASAVESPAPPATNL